MEETTPVAQKLRIAANHRILTIAAPPDLATRLGPLPPGVVIETRGSGSYDVVLLFTEQRQELEAEARWVVQAVRPGGLLWICYPKLTAGTESDLKREVVWDALAPTGWRPVAQIAVDETWSALRFVPAPPGSVIVHPARNPQAKRRKTPVRSARAAATRKKSGRKKGAAKKPGRAAARGGTAGSSRRKPAPRRRAAPRKGRKR